MATVGVKGLMHATTTDERQATRELDRDWARPVSEPNFHARLGPGSGPCMHRSAPASQLVEIKGVTDKPGLSNSDLSCKTI